MEGNNYRDCIILSAPNKALPVHIQKTIEESGNFNLLDTSWALGAVLVRLTHPRHGSLKRVRRRFEGWEIDPEKSFRSRLASRGNLEQEPGIDLHQSEIEGLGE